MEEKRRYERVQQRPNLAQKVRGGVSEKSLCTVSLEQASLCTCLSGTWKETT